MISFPEIKWSGFEGKKCKNRAWLAEYSWFSQKSFYLSWGKQSYVVPGVIPGQDKAGMWMLWFGSNLSWMQTMGVALIKSVCWSNLGKTQMGINPGSSLGKKPDKWESTPWLGTLQEWKCCEHSPFAKLGLDLPVPPWSCCAEFDNSRLPVVGNGLEIPNSFWKLTHWSQCPGQVQEGWDIPSPGLRSSGSAVCTPNLRITGVSPIKIPRLGCKIPSLFCCDSHSVCVGLFHGTSLCFKRNLILPVCCNTDTPIAAVLALSPLAWKLGQ